MRITRQKVIEHYKKFFNFNDELDENEQLIKGKKNEVIINFALKFANEFYGIQEYGSNLKEIENQLYKS